MTTVAVETIDERRTRETQEHNHREAMDDVELLRRVDRAGSNGYRLIDGDLRMLLAAYRLTSNTPPRRAIFRMPLRSKSSEEPWTLVFAEAARVSVALILQRLRETEER